MKPLAETLQANEGWLMQRVLAYAKELGFTRYTSSLEEAWRLSIAGLTASLCDAIDGFDRPPELGPDDDVEHDPLARFGVREAEQHRRRGLSLSMFLGLLKYYRQSYLDLLRERTAPTQGDDDRRFVDRCFDRIEIAVSQEWASGNPGERHAELESTNRTVTNEKNTYLAVFESLADAVLMLDRTDRLVNLNHAASRLVDPAHVPGGHYYGANLHREPAERGKAALDKMCLDQPVGQVFPWLSPLLRGLRDKHETSTECRTVIRDDIVHLEVRLLDVLDVSQRMASAIVVLRNITQRTLAEAELTNTVAELGRALSEVKRLSGLLPLCASCKKVRDDNGYWRQVEQYITDQTGAMVSHAICPDCVRKLYPELADELLAGGDGEG